MDNESMKICFSCGIFLSLNKLINEQHQYGKAGDRCRRLLLLRPAISATSHIVEEESLG